MKAEELIAAGIPLSNNDSVSLLYAEAAIDWMNENTTLSINKSDMETIKALPATAKLFVIKFSETMRIKAGVTSQSIEGLSQSFDATENTRTLIWAIANSLLSDYIKSQVHVIPARRRW